MKSTTGERGMLDMLCKREETRSDMIQGGKMRCGVGWKETGTVDLGVFYVGQVR